MPSRRESFNFIGLTSECFEELAFLLAQLEIQGLARTGDPDGGLDALVPAGASSRVPHGVQAKHHTRGPDIAKCAGSLRDAIVAHDPERVTYVFPTNPTAAKIAAFEKKVGGMSADVEVDWWGASQLTARLIGSDAGRRVARHVFGDDDTERLERLFKAQRNVDDGIQVMQSFGAGAQLLDSDPYFVYPAGTSPGGVPTPPPTKGAVMRVEFTDEQGTRHIDAVPRTGTGQDQMPGGRFLLEGEEAVGRWQRFLAEGGEVSFDDVRFEFDRLPKHIEPLWSGVERSQVVVRAGDRPRRRILIEIEGEAGTFAAELELRSGEPMEGWEHAVVGVVGEAVITINSRRRGSKAEARVDWKWTPGKGSNAEQVEGLRFLRAASGEGTMRMMDPETREIFSQGPTPEVPFDENMAALTRVYEDVVSLEDWLSSTIEVPEEIEPSDANALRRIARLIEGIERPWTEVTFALDDGPREIEGRGVLQFREQMAVELFGSRYELGEHATHIDSWEIASTRATPGGGTEFILTPGGGSPRLLERLERPRTSEA